MPECSLCDRPVAPEGGTVLFTDHRGIPFEVCDQCTSQIDRLHGASSDADRARALEYISGCADNIENRGVYNELMQFIEGEVPGNKGISEGGEEPVEAVETEQGEPTQFEESGESGRSAAPEEPAKSRKGGAGIFWAVIGVVLAVVLIMIYILGGIRF